MNDFVPLADVFLLLVEEGRAAQGQVRRRQKRHQNLLVTWVQKVELPVHFAQHFGELRRNVVDIVNRRSQGCLDHLLQVRQNVTQLNIATYFGKFTGAPAGLHSI